jgi:hypothetical protein
VESYSQKSDMVRRDQLAAEVTELNEKLRAAQAEAEYINTQEKSLGWAATKYNHVNKAGSSSQICWLMHVKIAVPRPLFPLPHIPFCILCLSFLDFFFLDR